MLKTVLILGQNGRFGRHAKAAFAAAGWSVRGFDRASDDLMASSQGVDVIVNAWNPPYTDWVAQLPDLHRAVRKAALANGCTVLIPGNVYVFGVQAALPWSDTTPHLAQNPLGRCRREMEESYRAAGVRTIILRAGDFVDTEASGNWFDLILTKSLSKGVFTYPGTPDIPHAWAFLPDLARAAVGLARIRYDLPRFFDVAFAGYTVSGFELCAALPVDARLRKMNWLPIRLSAPFWKMGRCLLEMRYLWNLPHWLDNQRFEDALPNFRATPIERALQMAVTVPPAQEILDGRVAIKP